MTPERLLALFDRVSEAPDAVARLRWFILDLAVRGKLIEQDSTEAPTASGGPLSAEEKPFFIPPSWCWVRVNDVATARLGKMLDKAKNRGTPKRYLRNVNVRWFDFDLTDVFEMPFEESELSEFGLRPGDVLICEGGEPGRAAVWDDREKDIYFQKAIHRVRFNESVDPNFFVLTLKAGADSGRLADYFTGTGIKHFTGRSLAGFLFPLPPLAEQRRIVSRVDELMALCNRLEAARADRKHHRERLGAELFSARKPSGRAISYQFLLGSLGALTTRQEQVAPFRQHIIDLAVVGKLTSQSPTDEPAAAALRKIRDARRSRRRLVELESQKELEALAGLPTNWTWTVVDQVSADDPNAISDGPFGAQLKTEHYVQSPGFRVIRLQNIGSYRFRAEHHSYITEAHFFRLAKHHVAGGDLVVAGLVDPNVRCCLVPDDIGHALVKADCYRFSVHPSVDSRFALYYLNSSIAQLFAAKHHHGMTLTRIGLGNFRRLPFPLPPLAEQHRIVARVDELMALCDQLEASLAAADTANARLLDAILHEALNGSPRAEAA